MSAFIMIRKVILLLVFVLLCPLRSMAQDIVLAGVPKDLVDKRVYHGLFRGLSQAGIAAFAPTFQYQEVPSPASLGYEEDFLPPCDGRYKAFSALKSAGIKLLVPAELLYPANAPMPPIDRDPLRDLVSCLGRSQLYGVTSYDEAIINGVSLARVSALYERIKQFDASIPVLQVHAPMTVDSSRFDSADKQSEYLQQVKSYARYADIVGFDVYPVPLSLSQLLLPDSTTPNDTIHAVDGYLRWLSANVPDRQLLTVLQGFSYDDLYEPTYAQRHLPSSVLAQVRAPTQKEISQWLSLSRKHGVATVIWWGQAALADHQQPPWLDILALAGRQWPGHLVLQGMSGVVFRAPARP